MSNDKFYLRFLDQVRPVDQRQNTARRAQPAWAARASLATADASEPAVVEGRVVGRIASGRILSMDLPDELI